MEFQFWYRRKSMKPNLYHERATKIYLADYQKQNVYKTNDFILNKRDVPDK